MTTNMITAARLIAHKSVNGKYQSTMMMDQFPVVGHQMVRDLLSVPIVTRLTVSLPDTFS